MSSPQFYRITYERDFSDYFAIVIRNVFSVEECREMIEKSEKAGYEAALVNVGGGRQIFETATRKGDRCIIDDPETAAEMWKRIITAVETLTKEEKRRLRLEKLEMPVAGYSPVGLNERLRYLRYKQGDFFRTHQDGSFLRGGEAGEARRGEQSFVTCQLYLNEGFKGGSTSFYSDLSQEDFDVIPETGSVLLFQHNLWHCGSKLFDGVKYAIRTDVMYTTKGPGHEYIQNPIRLKTTPPSP